MTHVLWLLMLPTYAVLSLLRAHFLVSDVTGCYVYYGVPAVLVAWFCAHVELNSEA